MVDTAARFSVAGSVDIELCRQPSRVARDEIQGTRREAGADVTGSRAAIRQPLDLSSRRNGDRGTCCLPVVAESSALAIVSLFLPLHRVETAAVKLEQMLSVFFRSLGRNAALEAHAWCSGLAIAGS